MEGKGLGSALVDVFDAVVALIKAEVNAVIKKGTAIAKEKGIGAVLLLGALAPLTLAAIFLILFIFFGLMRLGLGAWLASLIIALVSLAGAGAMAFLGIQKLTAEVETETPVVATPMPVSAEAPAGLVVASGAKGVPLEDIRYTTTPPLGRHESHQPVKAKAVQHKHDPDVQHPVVLHDAPRISVSTDPTFRDDMKKGGQQ